MRKLTCLILSAIATITTHAQNDGSPRLSPRPLTVEGTAEPILNLNGSWSFHTGTIPASEIEVPGEWVMQGYEVGEGETAVYTTTFRIPADWQGKRYKLRFDGVSSHATVKVNGRTVGSHEGSMVPFEFDVTEAARPGDNTLIVEVEALTVSDRLSCLSQYAAHTVGGILRKVTLFTLPGTNIASTDLYTASDKIGRRATLNIASVVAYENGTDGETTVEYRLKDYAGKTVASAKKAASGNARVDAQLIVRNARLWNPEAPYLYTLSTRLLVNGKTVQENEQRVGLRQVEVKGNLLLVNGKPVKLHGVNRHEVHPLRGRSLTPELCRRDAEIFKAGNCNYVRTSHYPPSEEFLDACDELGLFVESEAALCWIQHGASPIWGKWDYRDERFLPYMIRANVDNILAGRRHPSVIIWSLGNESYWSPLWQAVLDSVKKIDPSRPFSFHDQCWGGYNNGGNRADLWNFHYPSLGSVAACDTMSRPVLFGEYAHLSCYNRTELATDPGIRAAFGEPLVRLYDTMYRHSGCLGGALWSGIDDTFHLPDGQIVGYGPWGPIDGWRRPKPEYTAMKRAYSPFRIVEQRRTPTGIELTVENRYDFTGFDQITIEAGDPNGRLQPITSRIPARGKGKIFIPAEEDRTVYLKVTGPQGHVCAEELFKAETSIKQAKRSVKWVAEETPNALTIAGRGNNGQKYTIVFSKITGRITKAAADGKTLLLQGPAFCLVPMNADNGDKPNVANETYQNELFPKKSYPHLTLFAADFCQSSGQDGEIKVETELSYLGGDKGKIAYRFLPDGKIEASYEITAAKEVDPRQYGLLLQLPKTLETLDWERDAEFSVYPDDDIARPKGTARLNARKLYEVEAWREVPQGAGKDDANPMGSVDFRSTRTNIVIASLTDSSGQGVTVYGVGKQALRCWLQDGRIQMLTADYNNGGAEPFYSSPFTDGRIRVKQGDTLKGKMIFELR